MSVWIHMSVWMYVSFQRGLQSGYHSDLTPRDTNGRDKRADSLRLMTCGSAALPFRLHLHQAAADWAQWAMEVTLSRPVITGGLSSGVRPRTSPDFVRLALQARAFSVLLSSSPLSQVSDCHCGHNPHPQPLPLCLTAVFPCVSFAHLAPRRLFLKTLN